MAAHVASGKERRCALANAAVELPEKDHPARRVIEAVKTAQRQRLVHLCAEAKLADPENLVDELFLLLEGARSLVHRSTGKTRSVLSLGAFFVAGKSNSGMCLILADVSV